MHEVFLDAGAPAATETEPSPGKMVVDIVGGQGNTRGYTLYDANEGLAVGFPGGQVTNHGRGKNSEVGTVQVSQSPACSHPRHPEGF
jgi:hypothetical protein